LRPRGSRGGEKGVAAWLGRRRKKGEEKEGKTKKEKREKTKKRKGKIEKENKGRKIEKGFRKLGEFLGKLGEGFLWIFLGFSDTGVVADRGAGATRDGRRPERRRCRRDSWHARRRERNRPGFRKGVNELSWKALKTRVIY
jgi:hypothetical protein